MRVPARSCTMPAARNRVDLKAACAARWKAAAPGPPSPRATIISPSCEQVDQASTRFRSASAVAMRPAASAVAAPTQKRVSSATGDAAKTGYRRSTRNTPAATIVAECSRAETGVGPTIASGSQAESGSWALLPTAPASMRRAIAVTVPGPIRPPSTAPTSASTSVVPTAASARSQPSRRPTSPIRVIRNALAAAAAAPGSAWSKPIRRNEASPTTSQAANRSARELDSTSVSIAPTNRPSSAKKRGRSSRPAM